MLLKWRSSWHPGVSMTWLVVGHIDNPIIAHPDLPFLGFVASLALPGGNVTPVTHRGSHVE